MPDAISNISEGFKAYEEGKHRRYNLLFSVNGGAFAVAKLFAQPNIGNVVGSLTVRQLSIGMALFTAVMSADIFMFGEKMQKYDADVFQWQGKLVLLLIGGLISAGWLLAAGCFCICR